MITDVPADVQLTPLKGSPRTIAEWTTTFHLAIVALDPYTLESSWILETAAKVLRHYAEADVRIAFLVTCSVAEAVTFMGPLGEEFLVFADEDRSAVKAFGARDPAGVPARQPAPPGRDLGRGLGPRRLDHRRREPLGPHGDWPVPILPANGDPTPFHGTPVAG